MILVMAYGLLDPVTYHDIKQVETRGMVMAGEFETAEACFQEAQRLNNLFIDTTYADKNVMLMRCFKEPQKAGI